MFSDKCEVFLFEISQKIFKSDSVSSSATFVWMGLQCEQVHRSENQLDAKRRMMAQWRPRFKWFNFSSRRNTQLLLLLYHQKMGLLMKRLIIQDSGSTRAVPWKVEFCRTCSWRKKKQNTKLLDRQLKTKERKEKKINQIYAGKELGQTTFFCSCKNLFFASPDHIQNFINASDIVDAFENLFGSYGKCWGYRYL